MFGRSRIRYLQELDLVTERQLFNTFAGAVRAVWSCNGLQDPNMAGGIKVQSFLLILLQLELDLMMLVFGLV